MVFSKGGTRGGHTVGVPHERQCSVALTEKIYFNSTIHKKHVQHGQEMRGMRTLAIIVGTAFLTFTGVALFVRAVFSALDSIDYDWDEYEPK